MLRATSAVRPSQQAFFNPHYGSHREIAAVAAACFMSLDGITH